MMLEEAKLFDVLVIGKMRQGGKRQGMQDGRDYISTMNKEGGIGLKVER